MKDAAIHAAWQGSERCRSCAIRHLVLFSELRASDFERIHLPIDECRMESGGTLYRAGDQPPYVWTVRSGLIKLVQLLPDGSQRIVRLLRQGDLAAIERLTGDALFHDAVVLQPAELCRIPLSVVERLGADNPGLHRTLLARWQRALHDADTWITQLSTGKVQKRVARLLLYLSEFCGGEGFFLPTREDIGAMLGVTTESVSKVTADFTRRGLLRPISGNRATIDIQALRAIAAQ